MSVAGDQQRPAEPGEQVVEIGGGFAGLIARRACRVARVEAIGLTVGAGGIHDRHRLRVGGGDPAAVMAADLEVGDWRGGGADRCSGEGRIDAVAPVPRPAVAGRHACAAPGVGGGQGEAAPRQPALDGEGARRGILDPVARIGRVGRGARAGQAAVDDREAGERALDVAQALERGLAVARLDAAGERHQQTAAEEREDHQHHGQFDQGEAGGVGAEVACGGAVHGRQRMTSAVAG